MEDYSPEMKAKVQQMQKELKKFKDAQVAVQKNLATFDELDFKSSVAGMDTVAWKSP